MSEKWATGDAYEYFMGRWSKEVASLFLDWLNFSPNQTWLDLGCGTGALTRAITTTTQPKSVIGIDRSENFIQYAQLKNGDVNFLVADGSKLPFPDHSFDNVVSGLALNFIPQPLQAVKDMYRITKSGGVVATYLWDYTGKMEFLRYFWDAVTELDKSAMPLHEGNRFPICQPEPLRQLWSQAGFKQITVEAIDIPTPFDNFDSYWKPFTLGNFPAPNYVSTLNESQRNRLYEHLKQTVPTKADGSIQLIARVWAICGYK